MEEKRVVKIANFLENADNTDLYNERTQEYLTTISKDSFVAILDRFEKAGHLERIYRPVKHDNYFEYVADLKSSGIYKVIIPKSDKDYIEQMQEMYEKDLLKRTKNRRVKKIKHAAKLAATTVLVATTIGVAAKAIPAVVHFYQERDAKMETIMTEMNRIMDSVESKGGTISPEAAYDQALQNINARLAMEDQESKGIGK